MKCEPKWTTNKKGSYLLIWKGSYLIIVFYSTKSSLTLNFTEYYTLSSWRRDTKTSLFSRQWDTNYFGHIFLNNIEDFTNIDLT